MATRKCHANYLKLTSQLLTPWIVYSSNTGRNYALIGYIIFARGNSSLIGYSSSVGKIYALNWLQFDCRRKALLLAMCEGPTYALNNYSILARGRLHTSFKTIYFYLFTFILFFYSTDLSGWTRISAMRHEYLNTRWLSNAVRTLSG